MRISAARASATSSARVPRTHQYSHLQSVGPSPRAAAGRTRSSRPGQAARATGRAAARRPTRSRSAHVELVEAAPRQSVDGGVDPQADDRARRRARPPRHPAPGAGCCWTTSRSLFSSRTGPRRPARTPRARRPARRRAAPRHRRSRAGNVHALAGRPRAAPRASSSPARSAPACAARSVARACR